MSFQLMMVAWHWMSASDRLQIFLCWPMCDCSASVEGHCEGQRGTWEGKESKGSAGETRAWTTRENCPNKCSRRYQWRYVSYYHFVVIIHACCCLQSGMLTILVKTIVSTNDSTLAKSIVSIADSNTNTAFDKYCQYQYQYFCDSTFYSLLHLATFVFSVAIC